MRYRIGEETEQALINSEQNSQPVKDGLVGFSVLLGLLIGVLFVVAGFRAKQYWLVFWGAGLGISSVIYFANEMFGFF